MVRARACARTGYAAALGFVRNPFPQLLLPKTSLSVRLAQIKLAGFKSFADPTLIELKDAFTGVVGPNGCGKSNIIDAVRWVLGEGRASELRGSSTMTDLIFSGSATRAPIGRAMVELVLDNSDGTVKGPWAAFAELSVRRVVTRDGASAYFINHQQVRRRDVQEIFMGTGLGPKSYAIISQGMVTDFIKAKPEELRGYIEEAAGVSLYKERRRETETLLRGTRENLDRAGDLQVVKQQEIDRLRAEAETAARWKALEALQDQGLVKSIGVCNFLPHHFEALKRFASRMPVLNQIERHPKLTQDETAAYCREHGIALQAWSPLMQGAILKEPLVLELAKKYGRTPAQIVLRWDLQTDFIAVAKSKTPERIRSNARIFDFELSRDDVAALSAMNAGLRCGPNPETFDMNI